MLTIWQPLHDELSAWQAKGREPRLWLRDDDAVEPTPALDRLIELTARHAAPVVLAVIPARTGAALAARLAQAPHAHPAVHGWSHANHAPEGEKRQELGPHRPRAEVLADIDRGVRRLSRLYGDRLVPMLVPPWNRIDLGLLAHLPPLGLRALSMMGRGLPSLEGVPLALVNTHIDLIDWRGTRRCRPPAVLIGRLADELRQARLSGSGPVGILSHHLASDEAAFRFLDGLLAVTTSRAACRWLGPDALLAPAA